MPFYSLCHHYNFIKLYQSVDCQIFRRLYTYKHILSLNKAIAMRFSQNKTWYPVLNTWFSLGKNYIASIFDILFPEEPVLSDSPRILHVPHEEWLTVNKYWTGGYCSSVQGRYRMAVCDTSKTCLSSSCCIGFPLRSDEWVVGNTLKIDEL